MIKPLHAPKPAPLDLTLVDEIQQLVERGTLRAAQGQASIATVIEAYTRLEIRGGLQARPQAGFYVAPRSSFDVPASRMARRAGAGITGRSNATGVNRGENFL